MTNSTIIAKIKEVRAALLELNIEVAIATALLLEE